MIIKYGWTEDELMREITGLDRLLSQAATRTDMGSKCAHSYLKQVLKDKRRKLAMIKHHQAHDLH